MKAILSKSEAKAYLQSLPFKEGLNKDVYINVFLDTLGRKSANEDGTLNLADVKSTFNEYVLSFDNNEEDKDKSEKKGAEVMLKEVQGQIDKLLTSKVYSMAVERKLNTLQEREKALKREIA